MKQNSEVSKGREHGKNSFLNFSYYKDESNYNQNTHHSSIIRSDG